MDYVMCNNFIWCQISLVESQISLY